MGKEVIHAIDKWAIALSAKSTVPKTRHQYRGALPNNQGEAIDVS